MNLDAVAVVQRAKGGLPAGKAVATSVRPAGRRSGAGVSSGHSLIVVAGAGSVRMGVRVSEVDALRVMVVCATVDAPLT